MGSLLITGGSGFIGKACLRSLVDSDYNIYAITRDITKVPKFANNITWLETDLFNFKSISKLIKEISPTHLLHLAWVTDHGTYTHSPENIDWLNASKSLIDTFISAGGKRIVVAGSCAEYHWDDGSCIEHVSKLRSQSVYSQSKNHLFNYINAVTNHCDVEHAWGRIFFVYGPGEEKTKLVSSIIDNIIHKQVINIKHPGYLRDYIYIDDVAQIFTQLISDPYVGPINIGSGKAIAIIDIAQLISKILLGSVSISTEITAHEQNIDSIIEADISLLTSALSFEPKYNLKTGITNTINWYKGNFTQELN